MKKILLSFLAVTLMAAGAQAQHCAAATNSVTPVPFGSPGLQPYPENLPCTVIGVPVIDTIYFQNFTTVQSLPVQSLKIDTISNLPPGLCWTTNAANNTFAGGAAGVIVVSGTPTGPVGQYQLRIIVDVTLTGIGTLPNQNAAQSGLRYWIRTKCPTVACTTLDTASPYPAYEAYAACVGPPTAAISPAGNINLCSGSSQTLTASSGTGYTYKWSTGATTQSVSVNAAGSYVVTVYNAALDSAVSSPTVITLVNLPTVSVSPVGPDSICQGDTATLTATPAGLSYAWSNTAATTQTVYVTASGSYTVTVTDVNQCTAVSNAVSLVVKPATTPTITRVGFVLTSSAGTSYQWFANGVQLNSETNATLTVTANGNYTVYVVGANGCGALSAATSVVNVGINDINGNMIVGVYPNPTEGLLTLQTTGRTGDRYEIYDAVGRTVHQQVISADHMLIDMSAQPAGLYTLTVKHGSANETVRFAVTK
ncbi:MAG: hypothetical protein JWO03_1275 [Bacteroidetes bacterium]|nr:hypothetical protein [Bacteroidota bacterium]